MSSSKLNPAAHRFFPHLGSLYNIKLALLLSLMSFGVAVIAAHSSETIYPFLPVWFSLSILHLYLASVHNLDEDTYPIYLFILLGLIYKSYVFIFPPSLIGFDPNKRALLSAIISINGEIPTYLQGFYSSFAAFSVLGSEVNQITNLPIEQSYIIFPLISAIVPVLFSALIAKNIFHNHFSIISAAAVAAVGGTLIKYSIAPIPMLLGSIFFTGIISTIILSRENKYRMFGVSILFIVASSASHKIPLALAVLTFALIIMYNILVSYYGGSFKYFGSVSNQPSLILLLSAAILYLQWTYVSDFIYFILLADLFTRPSVSTLTSPAAYVVERTIYEKIFNVSHYLSLVSVAGAVGFALFSKYKQSKVRILQSTALITVGISVPSTLITSAPGFQRVFLYGIIFTTALIGIGVGYIIESDVPLKKGLSIGLVALLIILNPITFAGAPDYPGVHRGYINTGEIQGKEFANQYSNGTVHMDLVYYYAIVNYKRAARGPKGNFVSSLEENTEYEILEEEFRKGNLLERQYKYVAIRRNINIYRLSGGAYRLSWDPEKELAQYTNKIYSNSDTSIFNRR